MPRLAGQQPVYLESQLQAFIERRRTNPVMFNVAHVLSPTMLAALAAHFLGGDRVRRQILRGHRDVGQRADGVEVEENASRRDEAHARLAQVLILRLDRGNEREAGE